MELDSACMIGSRKGSPTPNPSGLPAMVGELGTEASCVAQQREGTEACARDSQPCCCITSPAMSTEPLACEKLFCAEWTLTYVLDFG